MNRYHVVTILPAHRGYKDVRLTWFRCALGAGPRIGEAADGETFSRAEAEALQAGFGDEIVSIVEVERPIPINAVAKFRLIDRLAKLPFSAWATCDLQTHEPLVEIPEQDLIRLPWTRDVLSDEQFREWLASREAAGAAIDIETCELGRWAAYDLDPYGARSDLPDEMKQIGTNRFVRSADSSGWVWEGDLPPEKAGAMYARIKREYALYRGPELIAPPAGFYDRESLRIEPPMRDGKRDWKAWAIALFIPRLRTIQTTEQLGNLLVDNQKYMKAAEASDPSLRREINDALANRWPDIV